MTDTPKWVPTPDDIARAWTAEWRAIYPQTTSDGLRHLSEGSADAMRAALQAGAGAEIALYQRALAEARADHVRACDSLSMLRSSYAHACDERDAARAELAALKARCGEVEAAAAEVTSRLGCGDNSCFFKRPAGMATNSRCTCIESHPRRPFLPAAIAALLKTIGALTPTAEPGKDGP
jgi:hypothetical protein